MATAAIDVGTTPVSVLTFFTAHPGMGGENLSLCTPYRALFHHRPPSRKDTTRYVSHDLSDSALSAQPRPSLDPASTPTTGQQGGKADVAQDSGSFHRLVPDITTVSGDGQPFLKHVATSTSTRINKTLPQGTPASRPSPTL
jgi:hypothetical protein